MVQLAHPVSSGQLGIWIFCIRVNNITCSPTQFFVWLSWVHSTHIVHAFAHDTAAISREGRKLPRWVVWQLAYILHGCRSALFTHDSARDLCHCTLLIRGGLQVR